MIAPLFRCCSFVFCCFMSIVLCFMFIVLCLLFYVCSFMSVVLCLFFYVYCFMSIALCLLLYVYCFMSIALCKRHLIQMPYFIHILLYGSVRSEFSGRSDIHQCHFSPTIAVTIRQLHLFLCFRIRPKIS